MRAEILAMVARQRQAPMRARLFVCEDLLSILSQILAILGDISATSDPPEARDRFEFYAQTLKPLNPQRQASKRYQRGL
jgi:hypothetical protein